MINYQVLESLVGTDKGARQKFVEHILGEGANRSLTYFQKHDIKFSKAEMICDYFGISLDTLRERPQQHHIVSGRNNIVGNVSINSNLSQENYHLRQQISRLQETIEAKNELIELLKKMSGTTSATTD